MAHILYVLLRVQTSYGKGYLNDTMNEQNKTLILKQQKTKRMK